MTGELGRKVILWLERPQHHLFDWGARSVGIRLLPWLERPLDEFTKTPGRKVIPRLERLSEASA